MSERLTFTDRLLPQNYIPQLKDLGKQAHKVSAVLFAEPPLDSTASSIITHREGAAHCNNGCPAGASSRCRSRDGQGAAAQQHQRQQVAGCDDRHTR